jgi:hypothetical protein
VHLNISTAIFHRIFVGYIIHFYNFDSKACLVRYRASEQY